MPSNCVICGNSAMKDPGVSFHRLPSSSERKRQWLAAFGVSEDEWCTHWRVCSRHFPDGNPKAIPLSYQEDQFATTWAMRKRAKLDQSRTATSGQMNSNHLNTLLAMQRVSLALPIISNTITTSSKGSCSTNGARAVHARAPPVLLPVASLAANQLVSGPISVITREPLKPCSLPPPTIQHQTQLVQSSEFQNIHVHELVVMPEISGGPSTDDISSETSGTDESVPGLTSTEVESGDLSELQSSVNHTSSQDQESRLGYTVDNCSARVDHMNTSSSDYCGAVSLTTQTAENDHNTSSITNPVASAVVQDNPSQHDVTVLVQSSLLAHIALLKEDNQSLREKVTLKPSSPLCVQVTDSCNGRPARGVVVQVSSWQDTTAEWTRLGSGMTNCTGECPILPAGFQLGPGLYQLHFDTHSYFTSHGYSKPYYPYVEVVFRLEQVTSCHHVSLHLSPFSYATSSHTQ